MRLRIKTETLKEMLNKAAKGASNNKMIALTGFIEVVLNNNVLSMTTYDSVNFLTVKEDKVEGEDFSVVLAVELFSKLISKTTSEYVTLSSDNNTFSVTGNGTYKIELPLDPNDGKPVKFPSYSMDTEGAIVGTIKKSVLKTVIVSNKPSLATTLEIPYLTGYLFTSESVISADSFNICINRVPTFGTKILVPSSTVELLNLCTDEDISFAIKGEKVLFNSSKVVLYSSIMSGADDYPEETVNSFAQNSYASNCVLPKTSLLNVLDRLSLFIKSNDVNGVYLTFTNEGLKIESNQSVAVETIPYQSSENFKPFTCFAGVDSMKKQISARTGEVVHLYYGDPSALKIVDNNVIQVVALLEDDRFRTEEDN